MSLSSGPAAHHELFAVTLAGVPGVTAQAPTAIAWDGQSFQVIGPASAHPGIRLLAGVAYPGFQDAHVHLGLVDRTELRTSALSHVVDLGWDPDKIRTIAASDLGVNVLYAGGFLAAPGGYPSDRAWAPSSSIITIDSEESAHAAVHSMKSLGATLIKVTSNSVAGPVLSNDLLELVVRTAHSLNLPVTAHAEGSGEAMRLARAGVDALAHAPFSEPLSDADLREMASRTSWISTLDIHGWGTRTETLEVALDNVRRFFAAGGRIRYGTDLGNGPLPVGLNLRECALLGEAGMSAAQIIDTLLPTPRLRSLSRLNLVPYMPNHSQPESSSIPSPLDQLVTITPTTLSTALLEELSA